MTHIEAMKLALEALIDGDHWEKQEAITALRQAIEQVQKQEPVAYVIEAKSLGAVALKLTKEIPIGTQLYTSPPQRQPLTYSEERDLMCKHHWLTSKTLRDAYRLGLRDAEATHGIKGEAT